MRVLLAIALLLGVTSSALAQQAPEVRLKPDATEATIVGSSGCWPVTSRDRVVVQMDEGSARTGTLLCMGPEEIMLTGNGTLPLSRIRQISKPRDSTLDGVLKGAAVGLLILAFCAPDCPGDTSFARRSATRPSAESWMHCRATTRRSIAAIRRRRSRGA